MELKEAQALALSLMKEHGLLDGQRPWKLHWFDRKNCFGQCNYVMKRISLSRPLVAINSVGEVKDTILHEIAHALTPKDPGHGHEWRNVCRRIGARPERCYDSKTVTQPKYYYGLTCPQCKGVSRKYYNIPHFKYVPRCRRCRVDNVPGTGPKMEVRPL